MMSKIFKERSKNSLLKEEMSLLKKELEEKIKTELKTIKKEFEERSKNPFLKEEMSDLKKEIEEKINPIDEVFSIINEKNDFKNKVVGIIISDDMHFCRIKNENLMKLLFDNTKFKNFLDGTFNERICFLNFDDGDFYRKYINSNVFVTNEEYDTKEYKTIKSRYLKYDTNILLEFIDFKYFLDTVKEKNYKSIGDRKAIFFNGCDMFCVRIALYCDYILHITNNTSYYKDQRTYIGTYGVPINSNSFVRLKNGIFYLNSFGYCNNSDQPFEIPYKHIKTAYLKNDDLTVDDFKIRLYKKQHKKD